MLDDFTVLEDSPSFGRCLEESRTVIGEFLEIPRGHPKSNFPRTRYIDVDYRFAGLGRVNQFIWSTREGDIQIDRMVRLYNIHDIQGS
jgi:hypothetical protein